VEFVASCFGMMQGGELYVPKIPSMRVSELAHCMAPDLPHKVIGIRPGEKLHEVMITEDDSRQTFEMEDRYVIEPAFNWWTRQAYVKLGAQPVTDGFSYRSDSNSDWLTPERLAVLLQRP
jgi:UDP-N-acetylglucosamine 4,6-dehydratase